jgi:hypothetical protein
LSCFLSGISDFRFTDRLLNCWTVNFFLFYQLYSPTVAIQPRHTFLSRIFA